MHQVYCYTAKSVNMLYLLQAPILLGLLEKMKTNNQHFYPQVALSLQFTLL